MSIIEFGSVIAVVAVVLAAGKMELHYHFQENKTIVHSIY
jgi:hypothetical protein